MDHGKLLAVGTVEELIAAHGGKATVEFELEKLPADAGALPGVLDGRVLRVETDKPFEEVARLGNLGLAFSRLEVRRATLETVFLNLTGRTLRD
jgi:ABC-2 type transport system ATP-binding protein